MKSLESPRRTRAARIAAAMMLCLAGACGEEPSPGRKAFLVAGCRRCHGVEGNGTGQGPPLRNLKSRWDEDTLVRFLEQPDSFRLIDPRIDHLARRYSMAMPTFEMPDSTRRHLAAYLLNR